MAVVVSLGVQVVQLMEMERRELHRTRLADVQVKQTHILHVNPN